MNQNQATGKNLVLEAALSAIARGWSVMPISRTSKKPIVKWTRWQSELPPVVKVRNWFGADYPDANLGVITGELSGFFILDCDDESGLEEIERRGGMPQTLMVQTRPDNPCKLHFYLQMPGFEVRNAQKKVGEDFLPGLDVRGEGGQALLPPSAHHSGAGNYEWLNDFPIASAPDWLLDVLRARIEPQVAPQVPMRAIPAPGEATSRDRKYVLGALEKERQKMLNCAEGQRHVQRLNSATALGGFVPLLSEQEITDALSVNFGKGKKGALDTIRDGIRNGMARPRTLPQSAVAGPNKAPSPPKNPLKAELEPPLAAEDDAQKFDTRPLDERGLTPASLRYFHLTRGKRSNFRFEEFDCYEYPTFTAGGKVRRVRQFVLDPVITEGKRYFSVEGGDTLSLPAGYNLQSAAQRLGEGALDVWVTDAELSTWFVHQAGLIGVNPFNLSADPTPLIKELKKLGAMRLQFCFDLGGQESAATARWLSAAQKLELPASVRTFPGPAAFTLADLRGRCESEEAFVAAIRNLPVADAARIESEAQSQFPPVSPPPDPKGEKGIRLLQLLQETPGLEMFHTSQGDNYVAFPRLEHIETYPLKDARFSTYCRHLFHQRTGKIIDGGTIDNVTGVLEGMAFFDGDEREVPVRTGDHEGRIYIDLCDDTWRSVEIGPEDQVPGGWRIAATCPVRFRRAPGMEALPLPRRGGNWKMLRELLNLEDQSNWILFVSWLVAAFRPAHYPYPVLAVHGEMESGKSTLCKIGRRIIDPNFTSLINSKEIDRRDLAILCKNSFVVGFDNLSRMSQDVNDALCSLVTESSFRTRMLHSNDGEVLFRARRPIVLNGINENLGENDLRRRCLKLHLPSFDEKTREKISEEEMEARFTRVWPFILGLIFDAISVALTFLPGVELPHRRGMLDFARWIIAAEGVLPWSAGEFAQTYLVNLQESIEAANEADVFTLNLIDYIDQRGRFRGSVSELLAELGRFVDDDTKRDRSWPASANLFGFRLKQITPNLRAVGIEIERDKSRSDGRKITIRRIVTPEPSATEPAGVPEGETGV